MVRAEAHTGPPSSLKTWLRERGTGLLALSLLIGLGAGLGAIAFRWLITAATQLFTGRSEYTTDPGAAHAWLPALGPWYLLFLPAIAGLLYGPLVYWLAPEAKGHGVPEVMYAVSERAGHIKPRVSFVKALASALCIGGGGSVGREGPIVQIGSALGSALGIRARLDDHRMRILVACGAAGGIAATFNAPLAGPFFAMELILRDFTVESFGAVVLSSVTASVVGRAVLGNEAFLLLPTFHLHHDVEFALFALLGVLLGAAGVLFSKTLYRIEDLCDRIWRGPEWLRPAVGGLLLGGLLLVLPQMYGVGYPVLGNAIDGNYAIWFLLVLLVGKLLATSLTLGIGGSGGVFAPSLFAGAMGGTAFGTLAHELFPGFVGSPGAYGLIGMGAAFAGAARAPITGVITLFEITGQYSIILPLMLAIVVATLASRALSRDTIYTSKLSRRGVDLDARHRRGTLPHRQVAEVLEPLPQTLRTDTDLATAATELDRSGQPTLPVVDTTGNYCGCVTAAAIAASLGNSPMGAVGRLARHGPVIEPGTDLVDALDTLVEHNVQAVPVLDGPALDDTDQNATGGQRAVGWISHRTLLQHVGSTASN